MKTHYETVYFNGNEYKPTTDVINELTKGIYVSEVKDAEGNKYRVHYSQKNYDNDYWTEPIGLWMI